MRKVVLRKVIVYGLVLCFVLGLGFLACVRHAIVSGLDENIAIAQAAHPHPDDDVAALIEYADCDDRGLSVLEKLYTGDECDHAGALCQYELAKAIDMCKNNTPDILFVTNR